MRRIEGRALVAVLVALSLPALAAAEQTAPVKQAAAVKQTAPVRRARTAKQAASVKQAATAKPASARRGAPAKVASKQAAPSPQLAAVKATKPAAPKVTAPRLTAAQIVQRNVTARGGAQAWKAIQAMAWTGKIELGYADSAARSASYVAASMSPKSRAAPAAGQGSSEPRKQVEAPFALELKRPEKSRMELQFAGKTAVQVYDGTNGWLLRPYLNRSDWEPFTAEQLQAQRGQWELGGPLMNAAARGTKVQVESVEAVEGRAAYKLKLTRKDGQVQHVFVDARSFLDVKVEGTPRRMDGKLHEVWITQREFRPVQGVLVPFALETAVDGYPETHRTLIEKVSVNPALDDGRFTRPKA